MTTSQPPKRTPAEQQFWDDVYKDRLTECLKGRKREFVGCAQLARDQSDVALTERRTSQSQDR